MPKDLFAQPRDLLADQPEQFPPFIGPGDAGDLPTGSRITDDAGLAFEAQGGSLVPVSPVTNRQDTFDTFGLDPNVKRGTILPIGRDEKDELVLAVPEIGVKALEGVNLPGRVMEGGSFTPEDVTNMALTVLPFFKSPVPGKQMATRAAPKITQQQLKAAADAAYKQADDAGVVVRETVFQNTADDIVRELGRKGYSPRLKEHESIGGLVDELTFLREQGPMSLRDLEILRRNMSTVAANKSKDVQRLASIAINKLDNFIDNLRPDQTIAGDASVARVLKQARLFHAKRRKLGDVEALIERAANRAPNFSGSGFENALRTEFKNLVQNPKRLRGFTPEERAALQRVARGGFLDNRLRNLGRFGSGGPVGGGLTAGIGFAGAEQILPGSGVVGSIGALGLGRGARALATRSTLRNVDRARDAITGAAGRIAEPMRRTGALRLAGPVAATVSPEEEANRVLRELSRLLGGSTRP